MRALLTQVLTRVRIQPTPSHYLPSRRPSTLTHSLQLLQLQSSFYSSSPFFSNNHTMSSDHGQISEILSFWFDDLPTDRPGSRWFRNPAGEKFDDEIRDRFGGLVDRARETEDLDHWTQSAGGSVALVLLLDQFPRVRFYLSTNLRWRK